MKRKLLVLIFFIITASFPVSAQFSAWAGYLKTQVTTDFKNASGDGFYAGFSFRIPVSSMFSLIPGLFFTRTKEQEGEFSLTSSKMENGFFIEKALVAPLHLQWGINLPSDIRAFLYAGPSFQYGLQCHSPSDISNQPRDLYSEKDLGPTHQRWNILVGGGAVLSFPTMFTQRVFLNAGWDYGLTNLYVDQAYKSRRSLWKAGIGIEF